MSRSLTASALLVLALHFGCSSERSSGDEGGGGPSVGASRAEEGGGGGGSGDDEAREERRRASAAPEEARRRTEAVRRAVEELATRGVSTNDYLMNLIVDDDVYRVSFVKQRGTKLRSEISVRVRQDDFEILSVEGAPRGGGDEPSP